MLLQWLCVHVHADKELITVYCYGFILCWSKSKIFLTCFAQRCSVLCVQDSHSKRRRHHPSSCMVKCFGRVGRVVAFIYRDVRCKIHTLRTIEDLPVGIVFFPCCQTIVQQRVCNCFWHFPSESHDFSWKPLEATEILEVFHAGLWRS